MEAFYDQKAQQGNTHKERADSPILPLRQFNNWIKACLIHEYTPKGAHVLDACCGKGGDLGKWGHAQVKSVDFVDLSAQSIYEAFERCLEKQVTFTPHFKVADISTCDDLGVAFYDVVSCQFALHYLFDTPARAQAAMHRLAKSLKPGGYLIGTIPSAARMRAVMGLQNDYCRITPTPQGYTFWLRDAIDNVEEFFVDPELLVTLAKAEGLVVVRAPTSFMDYAEEKAQVLAHMKPKGEMASELWDACFLYDVFVFQKMTHS